MIVDERPEVTAGAHHGPLRHDVLPGVSVALQVRTVTSNVTVGQILTSTNTALM